MSAVDDIRADRQAVTFSKSVTCVFISIAMLSACKPSNDGSDSPRKLEGPSDRKLVDALYDLTLENYQHSPESTSLTKDGYEIDRTNVSIGFNLGTTIGEVNTILDELDARILMMSKGRSVLFLEMKDPGDLATYRAILETLRKRPSVRTVVEGTLNKVPR